MKSPAEKLSLPIMAVSTLAFGAAVFLPQDKTQNGFWSFFFHDQYAVWVRVSLILAPIVLTVATAWLAPWLRERVGQPPELPRVSIDLTLAVVSFALFWFLRESRHWGDAIFTVRILEGTIDIDPLGAYFWKEPLDRLMAIGVHGACSRLFGWGAAKSVALLSALAGSAFVVVVHAISRRLGTTAIERIFILSLTLSMGAIQIFFGHVENYSLVTLAIAVFLLLGLRCLAGESSWGTAGLAAAVAVSVHPLASFLALPLVALPYLRGERMTPRSLARSAWPGALYLGVFYLACRAIGAAPLAVGWNRYADNEALFYTIPQAFAPAHLGEVLQNFLLIVPLGVIVLFPLVVAGRIGGRPDPASIFLLLATGSFMIYLLFFRGTLPRFSDWDLYAPVAPPAALWVAYEARSSVGSRAGLSLGLFAVLLSLAHTLPWILSNFRPVP